MYFLTEGFESVFPMSKMGSFSPDEVRLMLCGDQVPSWTREDVIAYTEPKLGFTKDSPGFLRFVEVLVKMSGQERKEFLQFATGCSSLPPGKILVNDCCFSYSSFSFFTNRRTREPSSQTHDCSKG